MRAPKALFCETSDGEKLAYSLFGKGPRKAIFFHGHPGSRVQGLFLAAHATALGIEIAAFDRAGFGHSGAYASSGSALDLSGAIARLASSLGWKRFHFLAVSGGAPYALSTAAALGRRVLSVQVVGGMGPLHERRFRRRFPWAPYQALRLGALLPGPLFGGAVRFGLRGIRGKASRGRRPSFLSAGDFQLLHSPRVRPLLRLSLETAFRQGGAGAQRDLKAFLAPWALDYEAIGDKVTFWHGLDDRLVPWEFSRWLAERIPGARLHTLENEGHYTLPLNRTREILAGLPE